MAGKSIKDMSDEELETNIAQLEGVIRSQAQPAAVAAPVAAPQAAPVAPVAAPIPVETPRPTDAYETKMSPVGELEFQAQRAANVGIGAAQRGFHILKDIAGLPGRLAGEATNIVSPPVVAQPGPRSAAAVGKQVSPRWDAAGAGLGELAQLAALSVAPVVAGGVMGVQSADALRRAETSSDAGGALFDAGLAGLVTAGGLAELKPVAPGVRVAPIQGEAPVVPVERGGSGLQGFRGAGEEIPSTGQRPTMKGRLKGLPLPVEMEAPERQKRQTFRERQEAEGVRERAGNLERDVEIRRNRQALEAPEAPYREGERRAAERPIAESMARREDAAQAMGRARSESVRANEGAARTEAERAAQEQRTRADRAAAAREQSQADERAYGAAEKTSAELADDELVARIKAEVKAEMEAEARAAEEKAQKVTAPPEVPQLPPGTGAEPPIPLGPAPYRGREITGRAERFQEQMAAEARAKAEAERQRKLRIEAPGTENLERRIPASIRDQTPKPRPYYLKQRPAPPEVPPEVPRPFPNAPAGPGPNPKARRAKLYSQGFEAAMRSLKEGAEVQYEPEAPPEYLEGFEAAIERFDQMTRSRESARPPGTGRSRR